MILLLDNYDSFVHNVARSLRELGAEVYVRRSDELTVEEAVALRPTHLVISPGPGTPRDSGISLPLVRTLDGAIPILGICLGHQVIGAAYGATVVRSTDPAHGRADRVFHRGVGILRGVPSPLPAGRYHSLTVDESTLPVQLVAHGHTSTGELMVLGHREDPVWGVQFHPESILTPLGHSVFHNFLDLARFHRKGEAATPPEFSIAGLTG